MRGKGGSFCFSYFTFLLKVLFEKYCEFWCENVVLPSKFREV